MMTRSRGTLYASGQITPRTSASLRETEEGSMVREGFRKVRDLLIVALVFYPPTAAQAPRCTGRTTERHA